MDSPFALIFIIVSIALSIYGIYKISNKSHENPASTSPSNSLNNSAIKNEAQQKYGEIADKYNLLQRTYALQTAKLNDVQNELNEYKKICEASHSRAEKAYARICLLDNQITNLTKEKKLLQNELSASLSKTAFLTQQCDELSERISQFAVESFRLSDIPPDKWDTALGIRGSLEFNCDRMHLIVRNYLQTEVEQLNSKLINTATSNLTAVPYMASIMADYETHSLELLAQQLEWGNSLERSKKVKTIREIRKDAQAMVEKNLEAKYQLEYLLNLFPNLRDVIETDYSDLPIIDATQISEYDRTRDWLSKEEYQNLSSVERNQLALDRYKESHNKTKWQVGRDYELYVGYELRKRGYAVDYFGSYMGMEDLGRDLIANLFGTTLIVQCKYWSQMKTIHEKHINQLYGTMICYCIEHDLSPEQVKGVLVTNITLSDTAKKMANYLHIEYVENFERGDYPCIKCNIGHGEGGTQKIYHLPFDQQYDATKIDAPGEFYAMTVQEAEDAGFRRAFKWFGSD